MMLAFISAHCNTFPPKVPDAGEKYVNSVKLREGLCQDLDDYFKSIFLSLSLFQLSLKRADSNRMY